jgi:esterase/lipase superfamily enzyme
MNREYHKWFSPHLQQEMELLVFGHAGARTLVFPTRGGRFYDYENWGMIETVRPKIENGWLQLFCLDSIDADSLYCHWRCPQDKIHRHLQYETYVIHEVLPFTRDKNPNMCLITHGCSMGAYHAVNFALRHPELVGKVVAFSGRYDLTQPIGDFRDLFNGYYNETIYYHTPCHFIPNLNDEQQLNRLRQMEIILVVGKTDPFLDNNRQLSQALWGKGIWHAFHIWPGRAHKPHYWQGMAALYL